MDYKQCLNLDFNGSAGNCAALSRRDNMLVETGIHPPHPTVPLGTECDTPILIFRTYGTNEVGAMNFFYQYIVPNGTDNTSFHTNIGRTILVRFIGLTGLNLENLFNLIKIKVQTIKSTIKN